MDLKKMLGDFKRFCTLNPSVKRLAKRVKYLLIRVCCLFQPGELGSEPVILGYHAVGHGDNNISISTQKFREQIKWLVDNDFNVMTLKQFWRYPECGAAIPAKTVVLTFDDGYENFLTEAAPVLQEFGLAATAFLITDYIGKTNEYDKDVQDIQELKMMDWDQIKLLGDFGWDLQCHTKSHYPLVEIDEEVLETELRVSRRILESKLGEVVEFFCFPYGAFDRNSLQAVERAGYKAAISCIPGTVKTDRVNRFQLSRSQVDSLMTMADFKVLFTPAYAKLMDRFTADDRCESLLSACPDDKVEMLKEAGACA